MVFYYKLTLTTRDGLSEGQADQLVAYFEKCENCCICIEMGENGTNRHVEGVAGFTTKSSSNIHKDMKKYYEKHNIEYSKFAVKIKSVTHLGGAFKYGIKELKDGDEPAMLKGWKWTWIQDQAKAAKEDFRKRPVRGKIVKPSEAPDAMVAFIEANNLVVNSKATFLEVLKRMGDAGYRFGQVKFKVFYADVMCALGDGSALMAVAENELFFLN